LRNHPLGDDAALRPAQMRPLGLEADIESGHRAHLRKAHRGTAAAVA